MLNLMNLWHLIWKYFCDLASFGIHSSLLNSPFNILYFVISFQHVAAKMYVYDLQFFAVFY